LGEHQTDDWIGAVTDAVRVHLSPQEVQRIEDKGQWMRRIIKVTLDDDRDVLVKVNVQSEWLDSTVQEAQVVQMFRDHGLPAPRVLAVDTSCEILPYPYLIQEAVGGTRLGVLLKSVMENEVEAIYERVGDLYRRMHAIHHERAGVWNGSPAKTLDVHPNDYMYRAEIVEGSGKRALDEGRITSETYERAVTVWAAHLDYLKAHQPSLIHLSAFPWTIYLTSDRRGWRVTKLTSLGDVLWWDPAYDVACLHYPPFGAMTEARWAAFLRGYGQEPERKRVLLYAVMQRLCAAMGVYMEPASARNTAWAASALADLDGFLNAITPGT
jgi:aminoglycoside/choline kinase family phosphotransferase